MKAAFFRVLQYLSLALFVARAAFGQGSLTPPAGPPAPGMKTLDQLEARTIVNTTSTPGDAANTFIIRTRGSYYFTGNITGAAGKHGISIQADDVTLDLNGFALIAGGGGAFRGIDVPAAQNNFCLRNGTIRGWTDGGARTELTLNTQAEKLRFSDNVGSIGLAVGNGFARDCVATGNLTGFVVGNGAAMTACAASANTTGFVASDRSHLSNCISTVNTGVGFDCGSYMSIIDCTSGRNGSHGIVVQSSSNVLRCDSSRNIPIGASFGGSGITAGPGCTIAECTADANQQNGIVVDSDGTIHHCTARLNRGFGIQVIAGSCSILENTCNQNSQGGGLWAGIAVAGSGSRIEGNTCNANFGGTGVYVTGSHNLVIRNTARGNTLNGPSNFVIAPNNRWGPIIDLTADQNFGVSNANSASDNSGTTHPWANFAF